MNLTVLSNLSLVESKSYIGKIPIYEEGEGPRWSFRYDNFDNDPSPDILLLGAYRHPNTGNNLVGGINLHYLNKQQVNKLAEELPNIMQAGTLYGRYQVGRRRLPDIFQYFYRTYNAEYIRGVQQSTLYPKYGLMKSTANWFKKKVGGLFKSKQQRAKEAEPQYPSDLESMNNRLDQVVRDLQERPPQEVSPDSTEMDIARSEYQRQMQQATQDIDAVERQEDIPYQQEVQDMQAKQAEMDAPIDDRTKKQQIQQYRSMLMRNRKKPTEEPPATQPIQAPQTTVAQQPLQPQAVPDQAPILEPDSAIDATPTPNNIEKEREENIEELSDSKDTDLLESITYYSPIRGCYVIEPAYSIVTSDWSKNRYAG